MLAVPKDFLIKNADENTANFMRYVNASEEDTERLLKEAASSAPDDKSPRTTVHEIVKSGLASEDKTLKRVFSDVATVNGCWLQNDGQRSQLVIYHVFSDAEILGWVRTEPTKVSAETPPQGYAIELRMLEQLPYLTAVLVEGMRLSPALGTRSQRIAPDRDLVYSQWRIPAGTPVGVTTLLMHMDEDLCPNPKRFEPQQ
ncbi:hypothetical protein DL769_001094 [Monosporascus sp. CRB-8-3]|nr:hypothetical protein DL769_001094 [Monosporascus sp. CRB-8-3]